MHQQENTEIHYRDFTHSDICSAVGEMLIAMMDKHQHGYLVFLTGSYPGYLEVEQQFVNDMDIDGLEDAIAYIDLTSIDLRTIEHIIPKGKNPISMSVFRSTLENQLPILSEIIEDAYSRVSTGFWLNDAEEGGYSEDEESCADYELDDTYRGYDSDND